MDRKQPAIRLTVRPSDELNQLLRREAVKRGTNVNQTMIYILNSFFKNQKG